MIHYIDRDGNTFKFSTKGQEADYQVITSRLKSEPTLVNTKQKTPRGLIYYKHLKIKSKLHNKIVFWIYGELLVTAKKIKELAAKM